MTVSRRQLLAGTAAVGAGVAVSGVPLASSPASAHGPRGNRAPRLFPPLEAAPGDLLALPPGFTYEVVSITGVTDLVDGLGKTPDRPDGTGCFKGRAGYRLVQNHEVSPQYPGENQVPVVPGTVYDHGVLFSGGCTVIETNRWGRRQAEWVGLSGTVNNCAGGVTPWGSWLTCEETEDKAGTVWFDSVYEADHGYVFEVFPEPASHQIPKPIKAFGRAAHEAAVVAPDRRTVYLTEDAGNGLFYRYTAPAGVKLGPGIANRLADDAGTLEAMAVLTNDGSILPDLAFVTAAQIGRPWKVTWVEVPDRTAMTTSIRKQFAFGEVTAAKKLEGAWGDANGVWFAASFAIKLGTEVPPGGTPHDGMLWYYDHRQETLTLKAYFPYMPTQHDGSGLSSVAYPDLAFDGPDNVHVTPYGSIVIAEDGENYQHLLSFTPETGAQAIARNLIPFDGGFSEMTGPTFTPDGSLLFGNVQEPGHVFAISGPWGRYLG